MLVVSSGIGLRRLSVRTFSVIASAPVTRAGHDAGVAAGRRHTGGVTRCGRFIRVDSVHVQVRGHWGVCAPCYVDAKCKRKRKFWFVVTIKSYVCVCVSRLRAVCTKSPLRKVTHDVGASRAVSLLQGTGWVSRDASCGAVPVLGRCGFWP